MAIIKPVFVMNEEGLSNLEKEAVLDGAKELLQIGEVDDLINIIDFGVWRNSGYRGRDGSLRDYQSIDWYLQRGRETSRNRTQLNANTLLNLLKIEPWRESQNHYDLIVLCSDMYSGDTNFVIGLASEGIGTVISTDKFSGLEDRAEYDCIKTVNMHELGHVFGLLPYNRSKNVEYSLGNHCTNRCIMRQGLKLPTDWINMTNDRLKYGALCDDCKTDLKNYFRR